MSLLLLTLILSMHGSTRKLNYETHKSCGVLAVNKFIMKKGIFTYMLNFQRHRRFTAGRGIPRLRHGFMP